MSYEELAQVIFNKKELAEEHFQNYEKNYENKNYPKASEFLWGTINAIMYALGKIDNKNLDNYTEIKKYLGEIIIKTNLDELYEQFRAAETLHANFYHNFMDDELFEYNREKAVQLINFLFEYLTERIKEIDIIS